MLVGVSKEAFETADERKHRTWERVAGALAVHIIDEGGEKGVWACAQRFYR